MQVFPSSLLADSRCPYCASTLAVRVDISSSAEGIQHGTLSCECYEYPVVDGIAVLRQMSPVSSTQNGAVERLHNKDIEGALEWLIAVGSAPGVPDPSTLLAQQRQNRSFLKRAQRLLGQANDEASGGARALLTEKDFHAMLQKSRPAGYANYLFQRFANPSFLAAIPAMLTLANAARSSGNARILDLLCGIGHSSATMSNAYPDVQVVMADADYVNLFIARRFTAPRAVAVCLDVEAPLPFVDNSFQGAFCLDGLHYVRSKVALLGQLDRVLHANAYWAFSHMHNAQRTNVNPGVPLSAQHYARIFSFGEQRLVPEPLLIEQFRADCAIDLSEPVAPSALESSDALTLFGGRNEALWRAHDLRETIARRADLLALNPLFQVSATADGLEGTAVWPSESLRQECTKAGTLLPERIALPRQTIEEISAAQRGGEISAAVAKLIRESVLVPLPECYPRAALSQGSGKLAQAGSAH